MFTAIQTAILYSPCAFMLGGINLISVVINSANSPTYLAFRHFKGGGVRLGQE